MTLSGVGVLVVDDEPLIRSALRLVLDTGPTRVVAEAEDGEAAWRLLRSMQPDVVLVDLRMPRMDGIELTRRISREPRLGDVKVVVLTTFADDEHLAQATRAGAVGYLIKSMPPEEIRAGVEAAAAGRTVLAPALVQRLLDAHAQGRVATSRVLDALTPRERDVLTLVARGLANAEIAVELHIGEGTVKTHVAAVLRKLEVRDRVQAAVAAYELGLVRPGR